MNTSIPRPEEDPDLARWGLVALALVIGAFMLVFYVYVLQDAVARGALWRYSQVTAAPGTARPAQILIGAADVDGHAHLVGTGAADIRGAGSLRSAD